FVLAPISRQSLLPVGKVILNRSPTCERAQRWKLLKRCPSFGNCYYPSPYSQILLDHELITHQGFFGFILRDDRFLHLVLQIGRWDEWAFFWLPSGMRVHTRYFLVCSFLPFFMTRQSFIDAGAAESRVVRITELPNPGEQSISGSR